MSTTRIDIGMALAGAVLAGGLAIAIHAAPFHRPMLRVIDGDTVELIDTGERIRIMGYDAPESFRPQCASEATMAKAATVALIRLLGNGAAVRILPDTHERDRYGRTLAVILVDGVDVAGTMIALGLGRRYTGGRRESWC